ncbi:MAG TPA: DUF4232 domain-containing protein [Candidatus Limnocylindrales bacterium]
MRAALLACGLVLALAGCAGPSVPSTAPVSVAPSGQPSSVPSSAPSAGPTAKPSHTPAPTPKPIAVCLATQLAAKVTSWSGATGHQIASVTLKNTSTHTCTVQGTPEVELVDAHGIILIDSQTSGPAGLPHVAKGAPAFHLVAGASLKTMVDDDNYCLGTPKLPTTVAFVLPANAGRLVAAPGPGGTVPPCTRTPGSLGTISMNGWVK